MKKSSASVNAEQSELFRTFDYMRQGILQGAATNGQVSEQVKEEATSRPRLLTQQILVSKQLKQAMANPQNHKIMHTVSLGFQPTAPVELVPKNRVTINDLMSHIGSAWLGKYFICRTIVWPMKQNAVQLVVEDTTETKAIVVSLYNCFLEEEFDPLALPRGSTLIIKNPYLKVAGSGTLAIRVDNPAEVEINNKELYNKWGSLDVRINDYLGEEGPAPNKQDFKEQGNDYFRQGKFHSAIRSYTLGIASNPENPALYTNRALCYLNIGRPLEAIKDSEKTLALEPGNPKAIWRKCVALSRLNQHKDSLELLKTHEAIVTGNSDLSTLQQSLEKFYSNRHYGKYDEVFSETEKVPVGTLLNYMEYQGPVQVVEIPGKNRGMIVSSDVKKGDVLIASRAFDIVTEDSIGNETILNANVASSILNRPTCQRQIVSVTHKLKDHPELRGIFYQLYAGPKFESLDPNANATDPTGTQYLVDIDRVEKILSYNGFGQGDFPSLNKDKDAMKVWSGIWILPSFINHSCTDTNVNAIIHGDFQFIVASKDISSGTELLISYFETKNVRYKERKKKLDRYGFTCNCKLCLRKR